MKTTIKKLVIPILFLLPIIPLAGCNEKAVEKFTLEPVGSEIIYQDGTPIAVQKTPDSTAAICFANIASNGVYFCITLNNTSSNSIIIDPCRITATTFFKEGIVGTPTTCQIYDPEKYIAELEVQIAKERKAARDNETYGSLAAAIGQYSPSYSQNYSYAVSNAISLQNHLNWFISNALRKTTIISGGSKIGYVLFPVSAKPNKDIAGANIAIPFGNQTFKFTFNKVAK